MRSFVLAAALGCAVSGPARGQEVQSMSPLLVGSSYATALVAAQPSRGPGFVEWSAQLESAKDQKRAGKKLMWIGLGVLGGTVVAAAALGGADAAGAREIAGLGASIGVGLGIFGGFRNVQANDRIRNLEHEGKLKGYVGLSPRPGKGAQLALILTF